MAVCAMSTDVTAMPRCTRGFSACKNAPFIHIASSQSHLLHVGRDEIVQPARVEGIPREILILQQADEVFDGRAEVPPYGQLLQREDHIVPRVIPATPDDR